MPDTGFIPWGAVFESGKKCLTPVLFPGVPFLSQVTNTGNWLRRVYCLFYTFSDFFTVKYSTIQHTYSTHHTQHTTTHSIQDPEYISTAHQHHMTSPDITPHCQPHYTTWHTQHTTWHHRPKLAIMFCENSGAIVEWLMDKFKSGCVSGCTRW